MKQQSPSSQVIRQFFLGFVRLHILHHASEGPVSGVDLSSELSRHGYKLSPGTLYPMLHALEGSGYLRQRVQIAQGRQRKVYILTRQGNRALTQARKHLRELVEEVMGGSREQSAR